MTDYYRIRNAIMTALKKGKKDFIIYPYGEYGVMTKRVLNDCFGIKEHCVMDNMLSKYNSDIKNLLDDRKGDVKKCTVLFTCANPDLHEPLLKELSLRFSEENIIDIFENIKGEEVAGTKCGKYSYGPLCNHWLIESVGAFCSFALGTNAVENHSLQYISTHPFLYYGAESDAVHAQKYQECRNIEWYFEGISPKGIGYKLSKSRIGNDVWLGSNVIITNGANIGNGVIAGAGAVITKDIPDYAVVLGVPARIVRYRYTQQQIRALNEIAWWDWPDEKIRVCYDDFYLEISQFIEKHKED